MPVRRRRTLARPGELTSVTSPPRPPPDAVAPPSPVPDVGPDAALAGDAARESPRADGPDPDAGATTDAGAGQAAPISGAGESAGCVAIGGGHTTGWLVAFGVLWWVGRRRAVDRSRH